MSTRKSNGKNNGGVIAIRSNVPVPPIRRKRKKSKYRLERLTRPGLSFHVPSSWSMRTFRVMAARYAREHGIKVTIRQEQDRPGFGCWRVK